MKKEELERIVSNISLLKEYTMLVALDSKDRFNLKDSIQLVKTELNERGVTDQAIEDHLSVVNLNNKELEDE